MGLKLILLKSVKLQISKSDITVRLEITSFTSNQTASMVDYSDAYLHDGCCFFLGYISDAWLHEDMRSLEGGARKVYNSGLRERKH